ncbi:MAG: hypothetical protein EA351_05195 [Gemmatimonadales bacterium]|nr:MAG: hypothetical protein EA351_05195 [Gemmatimonadales bacterium]
MTPLDTTSLLELVAACRSALRRRAGGGALLVALGTLGLVLPAGWLMVGSDGWRPGSPLPLVAWLAVVVGAAVLGLWSWRRVSRWSEESRIASQIERSSSLPDGAVRAQIELGRGTGPGASETLARAGEQALMARIPRRVDHLAHDGHRDTSRLLRGATLLVVAAITVTVGLYLTTPERTRAAWAGLASPIGVLLPEPLPPLRVTPGDAGVPRGTEVEVGIEADGRDRVSLHWESRGRIPEQRTLPVEGGQASAVLPPLDASIRYWVVAPDGARSEDFELRPEDPLLFSDLILEIRFPAYTGLPPERHASLPTDLELPAGSSLRVSGRIAGEAEAVELRGPDGETVLRAPLDGGRFEGEWRPRGSGAFEWELVGEMPAGVRLPAPLRIDLIADEPPLVRLDTDGGVREFPASLRLPLRIVATDDWGLDWVELEVVTEGPDGRRSEPVRNRTETEDRREVLLQPLLDLSEWGLEPGSVVRVVARAADRAPGPGVGTSEELVLGLPDARALRGGARDRVEEAAREIEALAERARRGEEELRDRAREARASGRTTGSGGTESRDYESREALRLTLEEQSELARDVEALREELAQTRESLEGGGLDPGLQDRMRELEQLLEEAGGEEAAARMERLMEQWTEGAEDRVPAEFDPAELAAWQEELRDRLEEAVERFRRAALESAFEGIEEEAGSLAQAQDSLQAELEVGAEGAAEAQDALEDRVSDLDERLEELGDRLRDAGDQGAAEQTEAARERLEQAREAMGEAAEAARQGDEATAGERGDQAAQDAREAAEALESARMEWLDEWEDQVRDALLRGAQDALSLARIQAELREEFRTAGSGRRAELLAREVVLIESVRNLGTFLGLATRQAGRVGRELSVAVGDALAAVERSAEGLRGGATPRAGPFAAAGQAQAALNQVALLALAGMEQIGEPPPPSEAQELAEELEGLAGDQESMNQEASSLSQDQGGEGAAARTEELASAQEAMAGALGDLADRLGGEQGSDDPLREMSEEARRIADAIGEGRIDAEVLESQASLLERLLEAGRSLERDGPTEEREGTPAGAFERPEVRALPPGLLSGSQIPLPSAAALERLSPAERRLVFEYFDRLNRRGGDTPPPASDPGGGGR